MKLISTLQLAKNADINLEDKMLSWAYFEKTFFIFEQRHEFSFPLKQISSIRYTKISNVKFWKVFWWAALSIWGIIFCTKWWAFILLGIILLTIGGSMLYASFKPSVWIQVTVSWGDKEWIPIPPRKGREAKELVALVNEQISGL